MSANSVGLPVMAEVESMHRIDCIPAKRSMTFWRNLGAVSGLRPSGSRVALETCELYWLPEPVSVVPWRVRKQTGP